MLQPTTVFPTGNYGIVVTFIFICLIKTIILAWLDGSMWLLNNYLRSASSAILPKCWDLCSYWTQLIGLSVSQERGLFLDPSLGLVSKRCTQRPELFVIYMHTYLHMDDRWDHVLTGPKTTALDHRNCCLHTTWTCGLECEGKKNFNFNRCHRSITQANIFTFEGTP